MQNAKNILLVRDMMKYAWDGYHEKGWGANEVRPISGQGYSAAVFGNKPTGATVVDALDTLWIMGLIDEFNQGKVNYSL
jgi:mannosyl-oligosaccharide alpha-1,2-mannosidase